MLTQQEVLTFERIVQATAQQVFRAFTHQAALRDWLSNAAQADPKLGGRIYLWWNSGFYTAGTYTQFDSPNRLAFSWRGPEDPEATEVRVTITETDPGRCTVILEHAGTGPGPEWAKIDTEIGKGWQAALENLQSVLETGVDLRFSRRPVFGVLGGSNLDADTAARMGIPAKEGFKLHTLLEGVGGHAAGLRQDDVIVALDGQPVPDGAGLVAVVSQHRAGDRLPVEYYRGPELRSATVELAARPMPEIPSPAKEMARISREKYAIIDPELDAALEGVTEAEADFRPSPGSWSVKEVLAHLIAGEEDTQRWMSGLVDDADIEVAWHANTFERLGAIASVYPTLSALLEELRRNEAITVALAESLPDEVVNCRHQYNVIAGWLTAFEPHTREHIDTIRSIVQAARTRA